MNNAESLLNEKTNILSECQEALNKEKIINVNLSNKYADLQKQYEIEKENYKLQHTQLNEKVIFIIIIRLTCSVHLLIILGKKIASRNKNSKWFYF